MIFRDNIRLSFSKNTQSVGFGPVPVAVPTDNSIYIGPRVAGWGHLIAEIKSGLDPHLLSLVGDWDKAMLAQADAANVVGWRVPTVDELRTMVSVKKSLSAAFGDQARLILPLHPLNPQPWASCYWSSERSWTGGVWAVSAVDGGAYTVKRSNPCWPVALQRVRQMAITVG